MFTKRQSEMLEQLTFFLVAVGIAILLYADAVEVEKLHADVEALRKENTAIKQLIEDAEQKIRIVDRKTDPESIQQAMFNWLEGKK